MNDIQNITARDAHQMLFGGGAIEILDVRQPEEYRQGHIEPSRLIPLRELPARRSELDRSRTVLTLCHSGQRSALAARQLATDGFEVRNITGGILAWMAAKLPVSTGE